MSMLHIRFDGRSYDFPVADFDLSNGADDSAVKAQVATRLEISPSELSSYVVDRNGENMTVRPQAVFG